MHPLQDDGQGLDHQVDPGRVLERPDVQEHPVERADPDLHLDLPEVERRLPIVGRPALHREPVHPRGSGPSSSTARDQSP